MILVLGSWCLMLASFFTVGYGVMHLMNKITGYKQPKADMLLVTGICFATVYAQIFSLFYKVGEVAFWSLAAVCGLIFICLYKGIMTYLRDLLRELWGHKVMCLLLLWMALAVAVITCGLMNHYDTYLYHAQSIHWIEEYGVVKGLGNLHNRLAYNSAFFALEALYSLKFLVNQSMHSMNGFITLLFLGYAVCSMKWIKEHRIYASDCLRLVMILFLNSSENIRMVSSAGSDHLALGLVIYILIQWVAYLEEKETSEAPFAYLCLLGVFAMTVKLSAAMIVLLVLMPAVRLIAEKQWKKIAFYISMGLVILVPFLARNVIISGYLLYPYPELDLFPVDWKMPAYTLYFDRNEIKAWGWGLCDVYRFDAPLKEWFPVWFRNLSSTLKVFFAMNLIMIPVALGIGIRKGLKSKDWNYFYIVLAIAACCVLWFVGAPLSRYGSVFLMLLPLYQVGRFLQGIAVSKTKDRERLQSTCILCLLICLWPTMYLGTLGGDAYDKRQADYGQPACEICYTEDGEVIYVPSAGDQAGYYAFPSTPYKQRLSLIEKRGASIADGFRMKEEYREANVTTYGYIDAENVFEK